MVRAVQEAISIALRDHQTSVTDWSYAGLVRELHRWVPIFDLEFNLQLPSYPVFQFESLRNAYATYFCGRGALGTKDNITFNTNDLTREPALLLGTLLHELLHLWQHYAGQPGRGNYHNVQFRDKALRCGLLVTPEGCNTGHTQVFTKVLEKYGVHLQPLAAQLAVKVVSKREVRMKKWRCGCTNVRCAVDLQATCLCCGRQFLRA